MDKKRESDGKHCLDPDPLSRKRIKTLEIFVANEIWMSNVQIGVDIDLSTSIADQQFFHFRDHMSCRLKFEQHLPPGYYTENKSRQYVKVEHNRFLMR
jgi:hypothetical protein